MNKRILNFALAVAALAAPAPFLVAFFDEVVALKAELAQWEAVHEEADFTDVLEQLDDIAGSVFTDVEDSAWFAPYVTSLADWGVVSGYKNAAGQTTGAFGPGDPVTVAEVLKMAGNAAHLDPAGCAPPVYHPEASGHWAAAYVGCAEQLQARIFEPNYPVTLNRPATRAEVLALLHDVYGDSVPALYSDFNDSQGHRFEADIAYASLLNVVSGDTTALGKPLHTFRPNDPVNRAEAAKIIYQKVKEEAKQEIL